jgi:Mg-chelatase subunit ChlD
MHSSRNVALVAALVAACGSDQGVLTNIVAESSDAATPLPLADAGVGKSETTTTRGGQGAMDASAPTGRPESSGDGGTCEVHDIGHGRIAPDILIVLDRSGSMRNRGTDRWGPSVSALGTITSSLDESVKFGLMVFPGEADEAALMVKCNAIRDPGDREDCLNSGVDDTCAAGTVVVPVGAHTAAPIAEALANMEPSGGTPTASSLAAAHTALGSGRNDNLDAVKGAKYVLLVTDGKPNCSVDQFSGSGGMPDPQAVTDSVMRIQEMSADEIKTYVLGYGTQNDADATDALNQMARAGGTGDQAYRPINDEQGLLAEFEKITGTLVSCDFALNTPTLDPSYVDVRLDDKQLALDDANGWTLSADHLRVTVQGTACSLLKAATHNLSVRVQCEKLVLR